jgi:hypothetical protein
MVIDTANNKSYVNTTIENLPLTKLSHASPKVKMLACIEKINIGPSLQEIHFII